MSTKSYFTPSRTVEYLSTILSSTSEIIPRLTQDLLFGYIPDFLTLYSCAQVLSQHSAASSTTLHPSQWPIHLGAQDCFWSSEYGPYTGEIVPPALASLGVTIVELGHAERRRMLAETDQTTAKKAAAVSMCGMIPLVCIGEIEAPDLQGPMSAAVGNAMRQLIPQVTSLLRAVPVDAPVIFAYEPVWAIGADKPAGVEYVGPVVQAIRQTIDNVRSKTGRTAQTKVIYGGSAGPGLWSGAANGGMPLADWVDGMFLGRFSHNIEGLRSVVGEVVDSLASIPGR